MRSTFLMLLLLSSQLLQSPPPAAMPMPSGGGVAKPQDSAVQSLLLRAEALLPTVEKLRVEADALAEASAACTLATTGSTEKTQEFGGRYEERVVQREEAEQTVSDSNGMKHQHDALGLRILQPVDGEIIHTRMSRYAFEAFLPPSGAVSFTIALDGRSSDFLSQCSWSCPRHHTPPTLPQHSSPGAARSNASELGCMCECSGACDCLLCARTSYSEVISIAAPKGELRPGVHVLAVEARAASSAAALQVHSYFRVISHWTSAFPSLHTHTSPAHTPSSPSAAVPDSSESETWQGITAPRFEMAGLEYSMRPHTAAGLGALWAGVAIHRPLPGEVFDAHEGVTLDLELLDFEVSGTRGGGGDGRLLLHIAMQSTDARCAHFAGCAVSTRLSLNSLRELLVGSRGAAEGQGREAGGRGGGGALSHFALECVEVDDCSRQVVRGLPLAPGSYRLFAQLLDTAGREVTGERERAFSVSAEEPPEAPADDPRRDASGWLCDPIHCLAAPEEGGGGGGKAVLLVYEWPPFAGFNGDADRARQLIAVLDALGFTIYMAARNCVGSQGDYLTKAPRAVGPRLTCGLAMTDVPAYLSELPRLTLVLLVSTFWYYPRLRSFPELWMPFLRTSRAAERAKLVVTADVIECPDGLALDEDSPDSAARPQANGAQLIGIAAADAVAVELADDARWLRRLFPQLPVLPLRFVSTAAPVSAASIEPFAARRGLIWFGSAHFDNQRAVEFVARSVLPRVRARGQSDGEARLLVVGAGTEDIAALRGLPGVEVVGHASDEEVAQLLARTKVCVSPTLFGRARFQTKHLQALARGVPVVATERGVLGYHLPRNTSAHTHTHTHTLSHCASREKGADGEGVRKGKQGAGAEGGEARGSPPDMTWGEEACGWPGVSKADCTRLLECCWVGGEGVGGAEEGGAEGAGDGGRCVRGAMREYDRGHGIIVAAPGFTRLSVGANETEETEVDAYEATLLAAAIEPLLSDAHLWALESRGALRLVGEHFLQRHVIEEMRALLRVLNISED